MRRTRPLRIIFPYMARWHAANRSRYAHLMEAIAANGHQVIIVQPPSRLSAETNYIDMPMATHPNVRLMTVDIPRWLWTLRMPFDKFMKKLLFTMGSVNTIRRLIRHGDADVLFLYNLPQYVYTFGSRVPMVFDIADDYLAMFAHELRISEGHPLTQLAAFVLRRLTQRADLVVVVSERLGRAVEHPNVQLLPNGSDLAPNRLPSARRRNRVPVIGYVGAFEYFIDLDLMLRLPELMPEATFVYVGAGREFARFSAEVHRRGLRNVTLTGALPHSEAMKRVDTMDVCLNVFVPGPVSHAASPLKLFEYLAHGKPVITTRLEEVLRLDPSGEIFLYADSAEEANLAVKEVLRGGRPLQGRLRRGVTLVRNGHQWSQLADQFLASCWSLVERRQAADNSAAQHETR